jgi:hypothetical protein
MILDMMKINSALERGGLDAHDAVQHIDDLLPSQRHQVDRNQFLHGIAKPGTPSAAESARQSKRPRALGNDIFIREATYVFLVVRVHGLERDGTEEVSTFQKNRRRSCS